MRLWMEACARRSEQATQSPSMGDVRSTCSGVVMGRST